MQLALAGMCVDYCTEFKYRRKYSYFLAAKL